MEERYVTINNYYSNEVFTIKASPKIIDFLKWLEDIGATNDGFSYYVNDTFGIDAEF